MNGGWHLPNNAEWNDLVEAAGAGTALKSEHGWSEGGNGTDSYGFSALPGGQRNPDGNFYNVGYYGSWWSASEDGTEYVSVRGMGYDYVRVDEHGGYPSSGYSVRCVLY